MPKNWMTKFFMGYEFFWSLKEARKQRCRNGQSYFISLGM